MLPKLHNFIDGKAVAPLGGRYIDNVRPATGEVYMRIPASGAADVAAAVEAAEAAFPLWSSVGGVARGEILVRWADLVAANLDRFVEAESIDSGKPVHTARTVDIPRSVSNLRFFGTGAGHFSSESHFMEREGAVNYTLRRPIGVVGCISPWNLPLYLFTWKIAPALAAGNCVVAKPSELTPVTASLLAELATEAGLPAGVFNVLHGLGGEVGQAIVEHPRIKAISFTGGTKTGEHLARTAAPMFKKLSLELGGKNAAVVFADANLAEAVTETVRGAFSNQGQICLCNSRILIERSIYERFKTAFVARVQQITPADPMHPNTTYGALISRAHLEKVCSYIALAREEGGTVLCGGETISNIEGCEGGFFLQPTVVEGLSAYARTNTEEIFGPVVTLIPFDTEHEALTYTNATSYGLAMSVWTQNLARAHRFSEQIESGIVWVNCWMLRDLRTPFGGVKQSGVGREGGLEAMRFFTEPKNICIKY